MKPSLGAVFPELPENIVKDFTVESVKISKKYRSIELELCEHISDEESDRLEYAIKEQYNLSTVYIKNPEKDSDSFSYAQN